MDRTGRSAGLAFLAKAFPLFDVFFELAAFFSLGAFALHEALLRLSLETRFTLGASFVRGDFGGSRSSWSGGLVSFASENFESFVVNFAGFLSHER